jgi:hypothetical protein
MCCLSFDQSTVGVQEEFPFPRQVVAPTVHATARLFAVCPDVPKHLRVVTCINIFLDF